MSGKLIVIEGVDGTGKRTQSELLVKFLNANSRRARLIGFPDYEGTRVGRTIGEMLSGKLGDLAHVHPYFSASLFALDRAEKRTEIIESLASGEFVVCDRYVYSNVAHQACRLKPDQRKDFLEWIEHLEFNVLGLPKPDITILLSMEDYQSQALREQRQAHTYSSSVLDIHELDLDGMSNARQIYEELGRALNWSIIDCSSGNSLRPINSIFESIIDSLNLKLPHCDL